MRLHQKERSLRKLLGGYVFASVALAAGGCQRLETEGPAISAHSCAEPLIRATVADDPALDAIGTLQILDEDGEYRTFCSATLISPAAVLTAKHCTMSSNGQALLDRGRVFFAVGTYPEAPKQRVEVQSAEPAAPFTGGVTGLGSDVAVYHLSKTPEGVVPLGLAQARLTSADLGALLQTYGFAPDFTLCSGAAPVRKRGELELQLLDGNVFDAIYGDKQAYLSRALADDPNGDLEVRYQHAWLLPGYEAWARSGPALAQTCHGDSGGPWIVKEAGQLSVIGVTSWTFRSHEQPCDYGTVFAILGSEVR